MSEYVISCCTTADLSKEKMEALGVTYALFTYQIDGVSYPDDLYQSISPEVFYKKIIDGAQPTTSQVSTADYIAMMEPILKEGKDILHMTLSSGISGSYNSACVARDMMLEDYPDRKIIVIDSLAASSGFGLLVDKAVENQKHGMTIDENAAWIEANKLRLHHWFFSSDLTSFIRGGRISKTAGFFGQLLNVCPVMKVARDGHLEVDAKARGRKNAIKTVLGHMQEAVEAGTKCFISQSDCMSDAQALADAIKANISDLNGDVEIYPIGTVIGSHTGPGTVALFFWGSERP